MADLGALIRLHKFNLDEKQKMVAILYRAAEQIEEKIKTVRQQIESERDLAENSGDFETIKAYGLFVDNAHVKIDMLNEELAAVNEKIETAQEELREVFSEMKKIEIIQRNRDLEEKAARNKKENHMLDEVAIQGFVKKQQSDSSDEW